MVMDKNVSKDHGSWGRELFGRLEDDGVHVQWHDFSTSHAMDWEKNIHSKSLEICINFDGRSVFSKGRGRTMVTGPKSVACFAHGTWKSRRLAENRHRFLTIEMSRSWISRAFGVFHARCPAGMRRLLEGKGFSEARPLTPWIRRAAEEMLCPPVSLHAVWYPAKIMEISAHLFSATELFCERQKRVAKERVERVKQILERDFENPPGLVGMAREVGCSQFHLSRVFSEETGTTISRYLRTIRLEKAAEFLRTGNFNVTEAAMRVGYSSLSHFSKAFAEHFGHCPCVFPWSPEKVTGGDGQDAERQDLPKGAAYSL